MILRLRVVLVRAGGRNKRGPGPVNAAQGNARDGPEQPGAEVTARPVRSSLRKPMFGGAAGGRRGRGIGGLVGWGCRQLFCDLRNRVHELVDAVDTFRFSCNESQDD